MAHRKRPADAPAQPPSPSPTSPPSAADRRSQHARLSAPVAQSPLPRIRGAPPQDTEWLPPPSPRSPAAAAAAAPPRGARGVSADMRRRREAARAARPAEGAGVVALTSVDLTTSVSPSSSSSSSSSGSSSSTAPPGFASTTDYFTQKFLNVFSDAFNRIPIPRFGSGPAQAPLPALMASPGGGSAGAYAAAAAEWPVAVAPESGLSLAESYPLVVVDPTALAVNTKQAMSNISDLMLDLAVDSPTKYQDVDDVLQRVAYAFSTDLRMHMLAEQQNTMQMVSIDFATWLRAQLADIVVRVKGKQRGRPKPFAPRPLLLMAPQEYPLVPAKPDEKLQRHSGPYMDEIGSLFMAAAPSDGKLMGVIQNLMVAVNASIITDLSDAKKLVAAEAKHEQEERKKQFGQALLAIGKQAQDLRKKTLDEKSSKPAEMQIVLREDTDEKEMFKVIGNFIRNTDHAIEEMKRMEKTNKATQAAHTTEKEAWSRQKAALEAKVDRLEASENKYQRDLLRAKEETLAAKMEAAECERRKEDFYQESAKAKIQVTALNEQLGKRSQELKQCQEDNTRLQQQLAKAKADEEGGDVVTPMAGVKIQQFTKSQLRAENERLRGELRTAENLVHVRTGQINELDLDIRRLKSDLQQTKDSWAKAILEEQATRAELAAAQKDIQAARAHIDAQSDDLNRKGQETTRLREKMTSVNKDLTECIGERERLQQRVQEEKRIADAWAQHARAFAVEIRTMYDLVHGMYTFKDGVKPEWLTVSDWNTVDEGKIAGLMVQPVALLKRGIETYRNNAKALEEKHIAEILDFRKRVEKAEQMTKDGETRHEERKKQLEVEYKQAVATWQRTFDDTKARHRAEANALVEQANKQKASLEALHAAAMQKVEQIERAHSEAESALEQRTKEKDEIEKELAAAQKRTVQMEIKLTEVRQELLRAIEAKRPGAISPEDEAKLKEQQAQIQADNAKITARFEDCEEKLKAAKDRITELEGSLKRAYAVIEERNNTINREIAEYAEINKELQAVREKAIEDAAQYKLARGATETEKKEKVRLEAALLEQKKLTAAAVEQAKRAQEELDEAQKAAAGGTPGAAVELKQLQDHLRVAQERMAEFQKKSEDNKAEIDRLGAELERLKKAGAGTASPAGDPATIARQEEALKQLRIELADALALAQSHQRKWTRTHEEKEDMEKELKRLRAAAAAGGSGGTSTGDAAAVAELREQLQRVRRYTDERVAQYKADIQKLQARLARRVGGEPAGDGETGWLQSALASAAHIPGKPERMRFMANVLQLTRGWATSYVLNQALQLDLTRVDRPYEEMVIDAVMGNQNYTHIAMVMLALVDTQTNVEAFRKKMKETFEKTMGDPPSDDQDEAFCKIAVRLTAQFRDYYYTFNSEPRIPIRCGGLVEQALVELRMDPRVGSVHAPSVRELAEILGVRQPAEAEAEAADGGGEPAAEDAHEGDGSGPDE